MVTPTISSTYDDPYRVMAFVGGEWVCVGTTALLRVPLSYKWIINDAKIFLTSRSSLESPEFSLQAPFKGSSSAFNSLMRSSWHLVIKKKESHAAAEGSSGIYFCLSLHQSAEAAEVETSTRLQHGSVTKKPTRDTSVRMSQFTHAPQFKTREFRTPEIKIDGKTVLISDCIFTILHPESSKALYSTSPPANQPRCIIDESSKTCHSVKFIDYEDIDKYLFNGALAIQVKATLHCIGDPIQITEPCTVPADTIREQICESYKDRLFTDVTLRCQEEEFKVHKLILASQSPIFRRMFEVDMKEKSSGIVDISDLSPAAASDLVSFLYSGSAPNVNTVAVELLNAAKKYELPRLYAICENELKMKIQVSNVIETLLLADLYSAASLKLACLKFIHHNLVGVQKTSQWKTLEEQSALLMEILEYRPMQEHW